MPTLPGTGLAGAGLTGGLGGLSTLPGGLNPLLTNPYLIPNLSGGTQVGAGGEYFEWVVYVAAGWGVRSLPIRAAVEGNPIPLA